MTDKATTPPLTGAELDISTLPTNEQVAEVCFDIHPDDYKDDSGWLDALRYDGEVVRRYLAQARAQQETAAAPSDFKRVGYFIREGGAWVATSSDDPRATVLYRNTGAENSALAAPPAPMCHAPAEKLHAEARECIGCGHVGINDASDTQAACHNCDWTGASPDADHCPGCAQTNCMAAACPKCGARYDLLAETEILAPPAAAPDAAHADDLAAALNAAVDAEYPLPDNPHASVIQRAIDNRAAMWRGIMAARKIIAAHAQQDAAPAFWYNASAKVERMELVDGAHQAHLLVCNQKFGDYTTPLYTAPVAVAPSDATGKADAANAGDYKLVPVEPTVEMRNACYEEYHRPGATYTSMCRAIIAAAPDQSHATSAADAKDAARYKAWRDAVLREDEDFVESVRGVIHLKDENTTAEQWDEAIDAAMAAAPSSEKGGDAVGGGDGE